MSPASGAPSITALPRHWWIATGNAGKLREIVPMVEEYFGADPAAPSGAGLRLNIHGRGPRDANETEATFLGNARIKARALAKELLAEEHRDFCVISDDSGLAVDALGGRPGVHSARYAGDHVAAGAHMQKLLTELAEVKDLAARSAHYHCALVLLVYRQGHAIERVGEGRCDGLIGFAARGATGFGYDPLFYVPRLNQTMAEMDYATKNSFSHRRRAFESLRAGF